MIQPPRVSLLAPRTRQLSAQTKIVAKRRRSLISGFVSDARFKKQMPKNIGILDRHDHGVSSRQNAYAMNQIDAAELATGWIEAWNRMDIGWLRAHLAPEFVHTSPFGKLRGRDAYLAAVEPMARKSVQELRIIRTLAAGNVAAVWFENVTPKGVVPSCDWVVVEAGLIREIRSFYDTAMIREMLSPEDQGSLGGAS
jgi:SnoaL-like domain